MQILHSKGDIPVQADFCRVLVNKRVTRCGSTYHYSHPTFYTELLTPIYLTREECATAIATRQFDYEGHKVQDITIGSQYSVAYISKGKKPDKGYCWPPSDGPFYSGGRKYTKHIEEVEMIVHLDRIEGTRSFQNDLVVFEDYKAPFLQGFMHTPDSAIFWEQDNPATCNNGLMQSFDGSAQVSRLSNNNRSYDDAIVMVVADQGEDILAGFKLGHHVHMCNRSTYATNVPGTFVYVVPYNADVLPIRKFGQDTKYTPLEKIQILTGNTAMFFQHSLNMYQGFKSMSEDLCRVERATIQNKLDHLSSGGKYALTKEYGPGYQLTIAASVAYVAKCEEKDATLANFPQCTQEIPLYLGPNVTSTDSQVLFADPLTYNLVPSPTIVTCDSVMPQKWVINGVWHSNFGNGVMKCDPPMTLDPRTKIRGVPEFADKVPGVGIFTKEQREDHVTAVMIEDAKVALENEFTASAVGGRRILRDGTVVFGVALPKDQLSRIHDSFLWKYFSWAWWLGENCSTILYILAALKMSKFMLDTAILFYKGWKNHGKLGKWVWGLVFYSAMDFIFDENKKTDDEKIDAQAEVEQGMPPLPPRNEVTRFDPQVSSSFIIEPDNVQGFRSATAPRLDMRQSQRGHY